MKIGWYRVVQIGALVAVILIIYFLPLLFIFYLCCGILDISRHKPLNFYIVKKYFIGNGCLTWLLSPINLIADVIAWNRKTIVAFDHLPDDCKNELEQIINNIDKEKIISYLPDRMKNNRKAMIFFKWYGKNIDNQLSISQFHQDFKYIKTIGVSTFNKGAATIDHFGPLRVTWRVLYNIDVKEQGQAYIETCDGKHFWHDNPLFIFDDTQIHKSVNHTDHVRYCMFIDILRPTPLPLSIFSCLSKMVGVIAFSSRMFFYGTWKKID